MPKLIRCSHPDAADAEYRLIRNVEPMGSAPGERGVVVTGDDVAPLHARIVREEGRHVLIAAPDLKVGVNGRAVARAVLADGDVLTFGRAPSLLYRAVDDAPRSVQTAVERAYDAMLQFSTALADERDDERLLEVLLAQLLDMTQADRGFVVATGRDGNAVVIQNLGVERAVRDNEVLLSDSIVQRVLAERRPVIVSDVLSDDELGKAKSVAALDLKSAMCAPMIRRGEMLGVIYLGSNNPARLFTHESLLLLQMFAAQAALPYESLRRTQALEREKAGLAESLAALKTGAIVGDHQLMQELFRKIARIAPVDVSVLVLGETGTGKELVAREIHARSHRSGGPFVAVNCGAIPENLLESELFGHVKGAFTGALFNKAGRFKAADGGTLFLDELGELPPALQVKLLRALEERKIMPVGASQPEAVDIRVVAATNRDLDEMVKQGTFRRDLFYRLNVVSLRLPALRDRGEDVILLGVHHLRRFTAELKIAPKHFTRAAEEAMRVYSWPGNVRELENRVRKAVIMTDGDTIDAADLELHPDMERAVKPLAAAREDWATQYILEVVRRCGGNRTRAAAVLEVDPRTVFRYLENLPDRERP